MKVLAIIITNSNIFYLRIDDFIGDICKYYFKIAENRKWLVAFCFNFVVIVVFGIFVVLIVFDILI